MKVRSLICCKPLALLVVLLVVGVGSSASAGTVDGIVITGSETTGPSAALVPVTGRFHYGSATGRDATIEVDGSESYQPMEGFGATLNDVDAYLLWHSTTAAVRSEVLTDLFSPTSGIGLDEVRIPVGGNNYSAASYPSDFPSELNGLVNYTEDSVPGDAALTYFNIDHDAQYLVPLLQEILQINPSVHVIAAPWTAPQWMKTNDSLDGGGLRRANDAVFARYLVKFIQAYAAQRVPIWGLSVENEPDAPPTDYPSMSVPEPQEQTLIGDVARGLRSAGLSVRVLGLDHNWNLWHSYAEPLLRHQPLTAGTAFHCYRGGPDPVAQGKLEQAFPAKPIYETECTPLGSGPRVFSDDLTYNTRYEGIEGIQDWSRTMMFWNLVLDTRDGPTTAPAQCPAPGSAAASLKPPCLPLITVTDRTSTRTVAYYTLGQFSKYITRGMNRICSYTDTGTSAGRCPPAAGAWQVTNAPLQSVAFQGRNGQIVLLAQNTSANPVRFAINWAGQSFVPAPLPAHGVVTYTWRPPGGIPPTVRPFSASLLAYAIRPHERLSVSTVDVMLGVLFSSVGPGAAHVDCLHCPYAPRTRQTFHLEPAAGHRFFVVHFRPALSVSVRSSEIRVIVTAPDRPSRYARYRIAAHGAGTSRYYTLRAVASGCLTPSEPVSRTACAR
jgi:glucosylceramidase